MKKTLLLGIAFALASCVSLGAWEKQGSTTTDFNADAQSCKAQAMASGAPLVLGNSVYSSCMQGKGWKSKE